MRRKKIAAALLSVCLTAGLLGLSGCGMDAGDSDSSGYMKVESMSGGAAGYEGTDAYYGSSLKAESSAGSAATNGGMAGGSPADDAGSEGGDGFDMPAELPAGGGADTVATSESSDSVEPGDSMEPASSAELEDFVEPEIEEFIPPRAGLLTAGEWCDNENWGFFTNLVHTGRFAFRQFGIAPYQRVLVQALSEGVPAKKVKVRLCDVTGSTIAAAVTDHNGKAYLYYNVYGEREEADYVVLVKPDGSEVRMSLEKAGQNTGNEADGTLGTAGNAAGESPSAQQEDGQNQNGQQGQGFAEQITSTELSVEIGAFETPVRALDLMFVFDTTGSMGDELMYLQKEFEDIAGRIADQSTRFSVNFYRDRGDVYVVRSNPFSGDIRETSALMNAESADGGGDYEEAVDEALYNAVIEHEWRENAVKILFLILDAPPHDTEETASNVKAAVDAAMEQGIRIIPIASSGVNETTEGFLRSLAMLTGGTYTFLTDDSGIGGSHLEPTIGAYTVEALNDLIVRLVKEYYGE